MTDTAKAMTLEDMIEELATHTSFTLKQLKAMGSGEVIELYNEHFHEEGAGDIDFGDDDGTGDFEVVREPTDAVVIAGDIIPGPGVERPQAAFPDCG